MKRRRIQALPLMTALGIVMLGVGLIVNAAAVSQGIRRGLEICGRVLIPSLFPFMALSSFLALTDYARILSIPLRPVTERVFKLPQSFGVVVLLSLVGGYPVGAKMIAMALEQGRIDQKTAERALCFCVNAGPSFVISAVGIGLFCDKTAGVLLLIAQIAATLLIGLLTSLRAEAPVAARNRAPSHSGEMALVLAVQSATSAMLTMCAFAILFSGLLSMVQAGGLLPALASVLPLSEAFLTAAISGFLEVTTGCIAASQIGGAASFALTSAILSFSGISVLFQIASCFSSAPVRLRPLILSRIAHAGISSATALLLYQKFCHTAAPVWNSTRPLLMQNDGKTTLISVCLLGMCAIFTLSLGERFKPRKK